MNRTKLEGHLIIGLTNVLFALNMIISKSVLPDMISPKGLTLSRIVFATIAFWLLSIFSKKEKVNKKDMVLLFLCGMFGIAINQGLFIVGLSATSPVDASILVTSTPMFVMILAFFLLKEPITWQKAGGVVVGATGAILLILSGQSHQIQTSNNIFGDFMILFSGLSYSVYLVIAKPLTLKYSSVTIMKWMFLFSAFVLLPMDYDELLVTPAYTPPLQFDVMLKIFYILFIATFITYLMIPMALKRIRPTTVSMYNYLQPIVASLTASLVGQDTITWEKIGSAALIFLGVYLVTISKSRGDMEKEIIMQEETVIKDERKGRSKF